MYNLTLTDEQFQTVVEAVTRLVMAPSPIVDLEGDDIESLRRAVSGSDVYRLRVSIEGGVKVKANEGTWTPGYGWTADRHPAAESLLDGLRNVPAVDANLAAMLKADVR